MSVRDGADADRYGKNRAFGGASEERRTKSEESMCVDCCSSS